MTRYLGAHVQCAPSGDGKLPDSLANPGYREECKLW